MKRQNDFIRVDCNVPSVLCRLWHLDLDLSGIEHAVPVFSVKQVDQRYLRNGAMKQVHDLIRNRHPMQAVMGAENHGSAFFLDEPGD